MTIAQQSPTTIHEHALVTRHTRQLEELGEKLRAAQGHETQLVAEQEQLRRAQHEGRRGCCDGRRCSRVG